MNLRTILFVVIIFCMCTATVTSTIVDDINKTLISIPSSHSSLLSEEVPVWEVGTEWSYRFELGMNLGDENNIISISISLPSVQCEITEASDTYCMDINGPVSGELLVDLEGIPKLTGSLRNVVLDGHIIWGAENLSLIEMHAIADGKVVVNLIPINLDLQVNMDAAPSYAPLQFPLIVGNQWDIPTSTIQYVSEVKLPGIAAIFPGIEEEYVSNQTITMTGNTGICHSYENISINTGVFPCYNITIEDSTRYLYCPAMGTIVEVEPLNLDDFGDVSFSFELLSTNYVQAGTPEVPDRPSGQSSGKPNEVFEYTTQTTDSEGDDLYYLFDWDDGTTSTWIGPVASGESVTESHSWSSRGSYQVRVKAKDTNGLITRWSDPLTVTMPRSKLFKWDQSWFQLLLEKFWSSRIVDHLR